jgi:hypothetical protein
MSETCCFSVYREDDDHYPEFLQAIRDRFNAVTAGPLFTTDCGDLFNLFLSKIPAGVRQHYTCSACRDFVNRFGGLVTISNSGKIASAIWDEKTVPEFFVQSVKAVRAVVLKAKVNGVFSSDYVVLGQPVTGEWTHMSVRLTQARVNVNKIKDADQVMAEKREEFKMLIAGLLEYPLEAVEQAVNLLKTESLYRSEKCLGVAEWLRDLHSGRMATRNSHYRENLVWLAVATAPEGFCHVKSSMIGTLLDDIVAGLSFASVSKRFAEKMNPLHYQRPQAPPAAGNTVQAEKLVEKMGIKKSLVRRYARLEELQTIWLPQSSASGRQVAGSGMFSHLATKGQKEQRPQMNVPPVTMTWKKFSETVLPAAKSIEYFVEARGDFSAILTAAYSDAPPILQWDREERRNPFSWYLYSMGSTCDQWNLYRGYHKVTGICYQPPMWYGNMDHQSKGVFFILNGAKDNGHSRCGSGLFPEILKSELHEVRSTIEAYSKSTSPAGHEYASACGINLQYSRSWDNTTVLVKTGTGSATYKLDRWD